MSAAAVAGETECYNDDISEAKRLSIARRRAALTFQFMMTSRGRLVPAHLWGWKTALEKLARATDVPVIDDETKISSVRVLRTRRDDFFPQSSADEIASLGLTPLAPVGVIIIFYLLLQFTSI